MRRAVATFFLALNLSVKPGDLFSVFLDIGDLFSAFLYIVKPGDLFSVFLDKV